MAELPIGEPGRAVALIDPEQAAIDDARTMDAIFELAGVDQEAKEIVVGMLGRPVAPREVAFVSQAAWEATFKGKLATPIAEARVASFRRICRIKCGLTPGDAAPAPVGPAGGRWPGVGGAGRTTGGSLRQPPGT